MVAWSDGESATNVRIGLAPNTPGVAPGTYATYADSLLQVHTDAAGHYEARVCPCAALMGFLEAGDGLDCQIVMAV